MSTRNGIFIAYCFPERKWLDRVQAVLKPLTGQDAVVVWDERKLHAGATWKADLADILASRKVAVMIVSEIFLESEFMSMARLPELLEKERANGLKVCWVLASHCLHELAGLHRPDAAHDTASALDGLGLEKREGELAKVAHCVALHLGLADPVQALLPEPEPPTLQTLDTAMATRHETLLQLRQLAQRLLLGAAGCGILALPALALGFTHFLLLAGFAAFLASQALLVRARIAFLGQGLLGLRYTRSGLADEALPNRQREPLVRKAAEIAD
ncbi:MAG: hypothetical protein K8R23_00610 [Chthoniobacter sp.]|nr:hypothetical protein [Chthoniobacter sp.]